ncbi:SH3 domain protein [Trypanosoma cruzi]|nr:SH3 domain protein [Trypanosoma cruzi]
MNAGDGSPIQPATSHQSSQAARCAAYAPPDLSNCPTITSGRATELIRKRRPTVVRRITDIPALGRPHKEGERGGSRDVGAVNVGAGNVPSGAIHNLLPHAQTANERGSFAAFLMAIEVAPSTRLQYATMLRSMLEMDQTPLGMVVLGL